MLDLAELPRMGAFAVIVREGSFTAAARVLGISKGSLSEQLRKLEVSVGARLLQRTTRRFSLTEAGEAYYRCCAHILEEAESANAALGDMRAEPTGTLKLTAPHAMGATVVIPSLVNFCRAYPHMRVDLRLSDSTLDLLEHDLDLAIRGGWPESSSLISKKLGTVEQYLCASPGHIARFGRPTSLAELASHAWVLNSAIAVQKTCEFSTPSGKWRKVAAKGCTVINSSDGVRAFLLGGHGVGVLPAPMVTEDLASGRLVRLLADHALPEGGIYAVYPSRLHVSAKVQRFIDTISEAMRGAGSGKRAVERSAPLRRVAK